jgi:hypothetical protein
MLSNDNTLWEWITVFANVPTCNIEVQVHNLLYCLFIAERVQDADSVRIYSVAISNENITGDVLPSANKLWTALAFRGPIKKTAVKEAVRLFAKRWRESEMECNMQGCPGSDSLAGSVVNAYFHMHRMGLNWVDYSRGMTICVCKMWTSQSLCLEALCCRLCLVGGQIHRKCREMC